jgi:HEAT repeats/NACHT domain
VAWIVDDLGAWLVGLLAEAGRRKIVALVLGGDFERALHNAAAAAVKTTAGELSSGDRVRADQLAMAIREVFAIAPVQLDDRSATLLQALESAVAAQLAPLEDNQQTESGQSWADMVGLEPGQLAAALTRHLLAEIRTRAVRDEPLRQIAIQLNFDLGSLRDQKTQAVVREVGTEILDRLERISGSPDVPDDSRFDDERAVYLARLKERYQRLDTEVLTPLSDQELQPQILLQSVFVPQTIRSDIPSIELPRELWRRLAEASDLGEVELPPDLDRDALERAHRTNHERPAISVLDAIGGSNPVRMVVLGDPGAGKSTLSRYIMLALASRDDAILPLLVELRIFADQQWRDRSFLDLIDHLHQSEDLGLSRPLLEGYLRAGGPALIVFDGLDEIFDTAIRGKITRQIEAFGARYPRVHVIVTSRVIGYSHAILNAADFHHWMLQDLDSHQIQEFTTAWYNACCGDDQLEALRLQKRLLAAVENSTAVAELAGNPMLLTILAIIGRRKELPRDRRLVYQHAVTVLVEHWDATGKHLRDARIDDGMPYLFSEDKMELLRIIAKRMQEGPAGLVGNYIPGPELRREFERYLRQRFELPADRAAIAARGMLKLLRERNFILALLGAEIYGFVHRAFLEYLAADDINERFAAHEMTEDELTEVFEQHWREPAWHEVLVLLSGMIPPKFSGRVIAWLLTADPIWQLNPYIQPGHLLLAIRCLGESRKPGDIVAQGRAVSTALIDVMARWGSIEFLPPELLRDFVSVTTPVFARFGPNWAGRQIFENWYITCGQFMSSSMLGDRISYLGAQMYLALLGHDAIGGEDVRKTAAEAISNDLRRAAAEALGADRRNDPLTFDLLRGLAAKDPDETVRRAVVEALASAWPDDPSTMRVLHDCIVRDPHEAVRRAAVQALASARPDDPATVGLLRDHAAGDQHQEVRQAAVEALASGWRDDPATLSLLHARAVGDLDGDVRRAALDALASEWRDDTATLPLLHALCASDPHEAVRQAANEALASGWRDDPATFPLLCDRAANDLSETVRQAAVRGLASGWRNDPATFDLLHDRLSHDNSPAVRRAAVEALASAWHDDPATLPILRDRADDDQDEVRLASVQALASGWRNDPATFDLLCHRLGHDNSTAVRRAVVEALASSWHDHLATFDLLRDRLHNDRHRAVRQAVVRALASGWHNDPATFDLICGRAVGDLHETVRRAALRALASGWRDDLRTLPLLRVQASDDQHWEVRRTALQVLSSGWHDEPSTFGLLCARAREDRHWEVRQTCAEILASGWHDEPAAFTLLCARARDDRHWEVRLAALRTIASSCHDDPATLPLLHDGARDDQHWQVRLAVVLAVASGWHDDPATLPLLNDRARNDQHWQVRQTSADILASSWHDEPATLDLLHDRLCDDNSPAVRQSVLQAMASGWHDDMATLPMLHDRAHDHQHEVRLVVVQALASGWRDDPATLPMLRDRGADDPHEAVRLAAVQALASDWRHQAATFDLLRDRLLNDQHWEVRRAIADILSSSWHDEPATFDLLRACAVGDVDVDVRRTALQLLASGWRDDQATFELLSDRLSNEESPVVLRATMEALASGWADNPGIQQVLRDLAAYDDAGIESRQR